MSTTTAASRRAGRAAFSAASLDGLSSRTVHVQVTDDGGLTATANATVNVTNVAPTATLASPASTFAGSPFTLALTSPQDPSAADAAAGFEYSFDCGSGYGAFGGSSTVPDLGYGHTVGRGQDPRQGRGRERIPRDGGGRGDVHQPVRARQGLYERRPADQPALPAARPGGKGSLSPTAKNARLASFRDQVDKSGAFTADQAATLKRLSLRL
jgi:hypothetical protein